MATNSHTRKDDLRTQLEGAKKQLAALREKLAKTPDKFPLLQKERRAKVQRLEAEIRVRYGVELEEPAENPPEIAKQAIEAVKDQRGTQANAHHPGLQLEEAKKRLAETPEKYPALRNLLQTKIQNLENEIRAEVGVEAVKQQESAGELRGVQSPRGLGAISKPPPPATNAPTRPGPAPSRAGFTAHFGVVPVTDEMKRGLNRIHEGFARAKAQLVATGKKGLAEKISAFEATYTKAYLERQRLPQAIELARRAGDNGWQVIILSETASKDPLRREAGPGTESSAYQQLNAEMGGQLFRIIPPFVDVYDRLREEFGDQIGDDSECGTSIAESERVRAGFLSGMIPMLYTTYSASGVGVSLQDEQGDRPTVSIFLGPPLSGVLLERAIRRTWGSAVESDTRAVFLAADSESDLGLMRQKVGPRLRALRATVLGERDSLASAISTYTDEERAQARQEALAYAEGNKFHPDATSYQVRNKSRHVGINDWSDINFPSAQTSKHKWMNTDEEISGDALSTCYFSEFGVPPPNSQQQNLSDDPVDAHRDKVASGNGQLEGVSVQNLDSPDQETPLGVASMATDEEAGRARESVRNADQKAMFFLAASIAMLGFLITHNAPAGWFKDIHKWWVSDFVSLASVVGLAVSASMMLAVLYPGQINIGRAKAWLTKGWILRCGFWIGTVAAFLALLFLILSKRPHHPNYRIY